MKLINSIIVFKMFLSKVTGRSQTQPVKNRIVTILLIFLFCDAFQKQWNLIVEAYKPIVIIHGLLSSNITMIDLAREIQNYHADTKIHVLSRFVGWNSLEPMVRQADELGSDLLYYSALYPEGFHLIGYSQGGLLSRALLQLYPQHRVKNFVSLSSPQAGQYGTNMLRYFFPTLVKEEAYELFYSTLGQYISIANYWNDPFQQALFYRYSNFLPFIDNESPVPPPPIFTTINSRSLSYNDQTLKEGIQKLNKMILIGGPDDGIIEPWQSSHFGYYDATADRIVDMCDRKIFLEDLIGLKSLWLRNALHTITVPGVSHHHWYRNETVIKQFILPWLD